MSEQWQQHSDKQAAEIKRLESLCVSYCEQRDKMAELLREVMDCYNNPLGVRFPIELIDEIKEAIK